MGRTVDFTQKLRSGLFLPGPVLVQVDQIRPLPEHAELRGDALELFISEHVQVLARQRPQALVSPLAPFPAHPRGARKVLDARFWPQLAVSRGLHHAKSGPIVSCAWLRN